MRIIIFILKYAFLKYLCKRYSYFYKNYIAYLYRNEINKYDYARNRIKTNRN